MRGLAAVALVGLALVVGPSSGFAQDRDVRPLLDRLDRLERDLNLLQRYVYRGQSGGAPVPVAPVESGAAVNLELRLTQLEGELRRVTGMIEELTYNQDQLKSRLEKLVGDVDLRLSQLERGGGQPAAAAPSAGAAAVAGAGAAAAATPTPAAPATPPRPPSPPAGAPAAAPPSPPPGAGANPGQPASSGGVLGTLPANPGAQTAARPPEPSPGQPLPSGSAQEQYDYAFGLLRRNDYVAAEQALRAFVQRHPNSDLAGNAQYWLGETFYVRSDYGTAASVFAEGYQKYPRSAKAPDNILKLGMALGNMGQKQGACQAFDRLDRDYPSASSNIKERARAERQRFGC